MFARQIQLHILVFLVCSEIGMKVKISYHYIDSFLAHNVNFNRRKNFRSSSDQRSMRGLTIRVSC